MRRGRRAAASPALDRPVLLVNEEEPTGGWLSRRAVMLHVSATVAIGGCAFAFWWQLHRALGGNNLSWAYTFEWPFFAALAGVMWWQQVHESPDSIGLRTLARRARTPDGSSPTDPRWKADDSDDPEMAAYNRYLAGLNASGRRKSWRSS